jgi:AraC-like DNA-binding protein
MNPLAITVFSFLGMVLSLMVSTVLLFFPFSKREYESPNIILGSGYLLQAYILFTSMMLYTGFILYTPHLYQTRIVVFYLILPVPFLYIRKVIRRKSISRRDLLLFIPALLTFLDLLPFYFKDEIEKGQFIIDEISDVNNAKNLKPGMFINIGLHFVFLMASYLILLVPQIKMLTEVFRIKEEQFWYVSGAWVRWLAVFILCQLMLVLPVTLFFWMFPPVFWLNWSTIFLGVSASVTALYLLTHPNILYGIKGLIVDESSVEIMDEDPMPQEKSHNFLSEEQINAIRNGLDSFILNNKPYLQKGYGLKHLSQDTGIQARLISLYINQYEGISFYDYINKYRIDHIKTLVSKEDIRQLTLEAISEMVGFNNRTSFVNAVKKFTGKTPSEYVNEILKS